MKQLELRKRKRDYHSLDHAKASRASDRLELVAYEALARFSEAPWEAFLPRDPRGQRLAHLRARARRLLRVRAQIEGWMSYLEQKAAREVREMEGPRRGR